MRKTISTPKSAKRRYLHRLQAAILRYALYRGDVHADSVVNDLPPPDEVHANTVGAAFAGLEGAGLIQAVGFERSVRGSRHRGVSRVWRVCDHAGARRYLKALAASGDDPARTVKFRLERSLGEMVKQAGGDRAIRKMLGV